MILVPPGRVPRWRCGAGPAVLRSAPGPVVPMDPEVPSGSASARPAHAECIASVRYCWTIAYVVPRSACKCSQRRPVSLPHRLDHRVHLEWITFAIHRCRSVYRRATETPIAVPDSFEQSCLACCVVQSCAAYAACRSSEGACDSSEPDVPGLVRVGAIATPKLEPCLMATEVAAPDATSPPALAAERASWGCAMQLHAMLEGSLA